LDYNSFQFIGSYNFEEYSKTLTRGGPIVKNPSEYYLSFYYKSDSRKELTIGISGDYWETALNSYGFETELNLEWKPNTQITFSIGPEYEKRIGKHQWVDSFYDDFAINTYKSRYVFAEIDQETISSNIRLNWTLSPQLSLQLFIQPLISVGSYSDFKELARPGTYEFNNYNQNGADIKYDPDNQEYSIDPDGDGPASSFVFGNPDFNYKSLRGNLVFRWEILPGSILYLVWTHDRTNDYNPGDFKLGRDFNNLLRSDTNDIFLAKFSYWLDI
jgi:hypothetical protein